MLHKDLNINFFTDAVEKRASRSGFGEGLLELGHCNQNVVGLCADLTESTKMHLFAEAFPERFIRVGITEQHMVACASGMAAMGKIPFAGSYAMFNSGRNWEHIRTTICYNDMPVNIIATHTGLGVGPDGGSHQALEDIALMRVIPRMQVIVPCDFEEAKKATQAIAETNSPSYLRLAREKTANITTEHAQFKIGKAQVFWQGENPVATIVAVGPMVEQALHAARSLHEEGVSVVVINSASIKPLDRETLLYWARQTGAVVSAETHQRAGGLGSVLAELYAEQYPVPMEFVGVNDQFGQSGTGQELMVYYGLDAQHIHDAVKRVITRK